MHIPGYVAALVSDERAAAALLADHLISLGHHRIVIITGPRSFHSATEREQGFRAALATHGIPLPDHYVALGDYGFTAGHALAGALLDHDAPPTAIFASNDITAAGAIKAAHDRGLSVPREVSIAGFDDSDIASMISPALTTIRRPVLHMEHEATRRLIRLIDDPGIRHRLIIACNYR